MAQRDFNRLDDCIADALSAISAHYLPDECLNLGLAAGDGSEAFASKFNYVKKRLIGKSQNELVNLGKQVLERSPNYRLEEVLWKLHSPSPAVSDITRRKLIDELARQPNLTGELREDEFFGQIWPLDKLLVRSPMGGTLLDGILQHMIRNPDWSFGDLFDALDLMRVSQRRFFRFLELLVHPSVRHGEEQENLGALINSHLERDGLHLVPADVLSGYQVYAVAPLSGGVAGQAKNLIFAADGPKPKIVLRDAINNDIQIVENEEHCLIYTKPIPHAGLRWKDLVSWWAEVSGLPDDIETAREFYRRLERSLGSEVEKVLFRTYFQQFVKPLADTVPALVPQVYLHYDPYTMRQLGAQRLLRQRMDFLLLLSNSQRVVIEVDGQQHYSENEQPSPKRYAEMVQADRELRLAGYEVYRFGGYELAGSSATATITAFFERLFSKHAVGSVGPRSQ